MSLCLYFLEYRIRNELSEKIKLFILFDVLDITFFIFTLLIYFISSTVIIAKYC